MIKRILIVDDEDLIRYSLSVALRQDDTLVKPVSCGKDALSEIDLHHYHLCFLDINLPDMNGLDIMKTVKQVSPATKIVIMTGSEVSAEMLRAIQGNANLLVAKPFDLNRIKLFVSRSICQEPLLCQEEDHNYCGSRHETFENWLMDSERQYERQEVSHNTVCSVVAADCGQGEKSFFAGILETSEAGMCIRTEYPLKPGQILRFSDNVVQQSTGVVRWSKGWGVGDSFRAGIQFVPEGPPHSSFSQVQAGGES